MTTSARDTDSLQSRSADAADRAGLRLVVSRVGGSRGRERTTEEPAVPCVVLRSAIVDKDQVALSVLTNLFKNLRQGERIEFVHTIRKIDSRNALVAMQPYRLTVNVACAPGLKDNLNCKVAEALVLAYPGFHFVACDELHAFASANPATPEALPHVLQFAPSGVVVTATPTVARFEQKAWRLNPVLGRLTDGERDASREVWPFPEKLANWPLTAPLYEPLDLPEVVEISIRVHAFSLRAETREALHQSMMRVLAGSLAVFHPESPIAAYSASTDLQESTIELMRHWLRHPSGYAVDCVVRSSARLSEVAQCRIAADVFGKLPFELVRSFDVAAPQRLAQPTLAWACTPVQGIPALMPGQLLMPTLAVPRHYPAPTVMPPQSGAWLGHTVCGRRSGAVALPYESRSRHVAIFGSTGAGKSALLAQIITSDIADPQRRCGVGLIDPHGDLCQRVLSMIPPARADDVVLVDTADLVNTACLNPLEGMRDDPLHAQFVVGEIMSLIDLLFETKDSSGPMTRNNLRNVLLLSASMPGRHGTFLDAMRILEDSDYCDYMLARCNNRNVVDYWRKFREMRGSDNGYVEWAPYIMARLAPFVTSPIMKRLLSRPDSTIDLAQAMRDKKIVLFNLNKGVLQDIECQVLGSLILMKFFSAALSRARVSVKQHAPFHLYVDEFSTFATDSVPRMFSEGRKYGLCLTTANQSLGQLQNRWGRSNIAESILANTATKFLFRLGPSDVEILQPYFQPQFNAGDMATLPDFHAVACMSDRNRPLPPFVLRANLAATNPDEHVPAADLLNLSRQRYTVPTDQANKELMKLYDLSAESLGTAEPASTPDRSHEKGPPDDANESTASKLLTCPRSVGEASQPTTARAVGV